MAQETTRRPLVGRLAPSPTGLLHLGHARSFLLAWWQARSRSGRVVLRMEDLDGPRVEPRFVSAALRDLEWLGLDWDEWLLQSERQEQLQHALGKLVDRGLAYPCICSRAAVRAAQSAPQQGTLEPRYPGTCRGRFASAEQARRAGGQEVGYRFVVERGSVEVDDGFSGRHAFDVHGAVGDFMIGRRDGTPAYQLAVVVDDAAQSVTEVVRGDDLLPSAARQILLLRALGLEVPSYFHVPLVLDAEGRRLAKRHNDLSLAELREQGVDPRVIVQWVAASAGLPSSDRLSARELTPFFQMKSVPRTSVTLGEQTLKRLLSEVR